MNEEIVDLLLVEDREEDAELAIMALKQSKLVNSVKWINNGDDALNFIFAREQFEGRKGLPLPKLVLLDIKMPRVSGIDVLRQIRSHPETYSLPVVILTTSREEQDKIEAYNLAVNSYIVKPVDFSGFIKSVQDIGFYWLLLNEPPPSTL